MKKWLAVAAIAIAMGVLLALLTRSTAPVALSRSAAPEAERDRVSSTDQSSKAAPAVARAAPALKRPKVEPDPASPNYDAAEKSRELLVNPGAVYREEPRDPVWAPAMEKTITDQVAKDIAGAGVDLKVSTECHKMSCMVKLEGPTKQEIEKGSVLMQYVPMGEIFAPEGNGRFVLLFTRDERELVAWREEYGRNRAVWLARRRTEAAEKKFPDWFPPVPKE